MKKIIVSALAAFFMFSSAYSIETGKEATDFTLKTMDGNDFTLSSQKGKVVVLDFWASWCAPCREEFPFLVELANQNKDNAFSVVAVNIDKKSANAKAFIQKLKVEVPFIVPCDPDSKNPALYGVENMPTTFVIDKKGVIRYIHKGFLESYKEEYKKQIAELLAE